MGMRWSAQERSRRRAAGVVVATVVALLGSLFFTTPGVAKSGFALTRIAGTDRYDTARLNATTTFGQSTVVVLSSGQSFPDALTGNYLAGLIQVPILLTTRDAVPSPTLAALT